MPISKATNDTVTMGACNSQLYIGAAHRQTCNFIIIIVIIVTRAAAAAEHSIKATAGCADRMGVSLLTVGVSHCT